MKLKEMKEIKESRKNMIGFLHMSDENEINSLLNKWGNITKKPFWNACDIVIEAYKNKNISNRIASKIFDIFADSNRYFRTESHRFECGKIYEYSKSQNAYIFLKMGTKKEFNKLNHYMD